MKRRTIIAAFSVLFLVLVGVAVAVTLLKTPGKPGPECHQGLCGPAGVVPLRSGTDYVNARFGYRLSYSANAFSVAGDERGITLTATPRLRDALGISGEMVIRVQGAGATEAVPQQWLEAQRAALAGSTAGGLTGNTDPKFAVLGAEIGYHQGTGATWSGNAADPGGGAGSNVLVFGEAATDGKVTIAATVLIDEPDFQTVIGALQIADTLVNGIRFAGDTA